MVKRELRKKPGIAAPSIVKQPIISLLEFLEIGELNDSTWVARLQSDVNPAGTPLPQNCSTSTIFLVELAHLGDCVCEETNAY